MLKLVRTARRRALPALLVLGGATLAQSFLPSCRTALTTVNPCGTVFAFCTANQLDALYGDVPDPYLDPTCTIPFYGQRAPGGGGGTGVCSDLPDSIYGSTPGPRPDGRR